MFFLNFACIYNWWYRTHKNQRDSVHAHPQANITNWLLATLIMTHGYWSLPSFNEKEFSSQSAQSRLQPELIKLAVSGFGWWGVSPSSQHSQLESSQIL